MWSCLFLFVTLRTTNCQTLVLALWNSCCHEPNMPVYVAENALRNALSLCTAHVAARHMVHQQLYCREHRASFVSLQPLLTRDTWEPSIIHNFSPFMPNGTIWFHSVLRVYARRAAPAQIGELTPPFAPIGPVHMGPPPPPPPPRTSLLYAPPLPASLAAH